MSGKSERRRRLKAAHAAKHAEFVNWCVRFDEWDMPHYQWVHRHMRDRVESLARTTD